MCRKSFPQTINDELGFSRLRKDKGMKVPRFSRASFIFDNLYLEKCERSMGQMLTNYYHDIQWLLNKLHQSDICD